jgi:hypothetical protein
MTRAVCLLSLLGLATLANAQLFVGLETAGVSAKLGDMSNFPNVTYTDLFQFEISGAAAAPDGTLYLCNGAFTTKLYRSINLGTPQLLATLSEDIHALAFGRGKLYGYSNYASPKGIYEINPDTGDCALVLDVYTDTGFRFFALDYNPMDDLFYGYTEYGDSGLYSINIDTGEMIKIVGTIPASNGQGRGMAVGNSTVYLTATRGDDGIPFFAYDLSQEPAGEWVPFTQAYPNYHSTGGATWIPEPCAGDLDGDNDTDQSDLGILLADWGCTSSCTGDLDGDDDTDQSDLGILLADWGCGVGP